VLLDVLIKMQLHQRFLLDILTLRLKYFVRLLIHQLYLCPGLALAGVGPNARPRHGAPLLWAVVLLCHLAQSAILTYDLFNGDFLQNNYTYLYEIKKRQQIIWQQRKSEHKSLETLELICM